MITDAARPARGGNGLNNRHAALRPEPEMITPTPGDALSQRRMARRSGWTGSRGRRWLATWLMGGVMGLSTLPAWAQLDVNRASAEELMQLPGVGPVRAERIVQARAQRPFTDWADFQARVAGVGPKTAEALSAHGLRVQGRSYGQDIAQGRVTPGRRSPQPPRP